MTLGGRMKTALTKAGLSVEKGAERLGVSRATLYDYIKGKYSPRHDLIFRLAGLSGTDPDWLLTGEESNKPALQAAEEETGYDSRSFGEARRVLEIAKLILERGETCWNRREMDLTDEERRLIRGYREAIEPIRKIVRVALTAISVEENPPPATNG